MAAKQIRKTTKAATPKATVEENVVEEAVVAKPVKTKKKFADTDPIPCKSITAGELGMIGVKTKINYTWFGRGEVIDVEYQDLAAAIRSGKKQVLAPMFIIQDEDFVNEFPQVAKVYENMFSTDDLRDIFDLSVSQMRSVITQLPSGAKESIKHIAASEISAGRLDSVAKIRVLDEIFETKYMLMTELVN